MEEYDVDNWRLFQTMVKRGWNDNLIYGGVRLANASFPSLYTDTLMGEDFKNVSFEEQIGRLSAVHEYNRATSEERLKIQSARLEAEHIEELKRFNIDPEKLSGVEKALYMGGFLLGAAADPTLLVPVGLGMKAAHVAGKGVQLAGKAKYLGSAAAIGAIDGVARAGAADFVEDGTWDHPDDIATGGAVGAGIGAALGLGGVAWASLRLRRLNKLRAGQDIDKIDVNAAIKDGITAGDSVSEEAAKYMETNADFATMALYGITRNAATEEQLLAHGVFGSYVNKGAQDSFKKFMSRYAVQEGMNPKEMLEFIGSNNFGEMSDKYVLFENKLLQAVEEGELANLIKNAPPEQVELWHRALDASATRIESTADFLGHSANKTLNTKNVEGVIDELNFFDNIARDRVQDSIDHAKALKDIEDVRNVPLTVTDKKGATTGFKAMERAANTRAELINPQRWAYRYANDPDRTYHVVPTKDSVISAYQQKNLEDSVEALRVKWANRTPWAGRDFETEYMKQSDIDKLISYLEADSAIAAKGAKPEIPDAPWVHPAPRTPWGSLANDVEGLAYGDPSASKYIDEVASDITNDVAERFNKQSGKALPNLMLNLGLGTLGAVTVGGATGDPVSALIGAGVFAGTPWVLRKAMNVLRKEGVVVSGNESIGNKLNMSPEEGQARTLLNFNAGAAKALYTGNRVIRNWGPTGTAAMETLRQFDSAVTMATSRAVYSINRTANKAGMSQKALAENTNIIDYMLRRKKPADLTPGELAVAKELDRLTMHILDSHKKVGAISPEQYQQILSDRKRRGFWPIVINEGFLFTSRGKQQWKETFVNATWSPGELHAAIKVLVGDQYGADDIIKSILLRSTKHPTGNMSLTEEGAQELLERKILTPFSVIHSDSRQDLLQGILRPFTVTDPVNAFQDFLNFSYRRIYEHRLFGGDLIDKKGRKVFNKHANIVKWADQILAETGSTKAKQYFLEQMYTSVGSMKSKLIRETATQDRMWQQLYGKAKAINILKLGTAAIVNLPQAIVAGTIRLSRVKNTTPVIGVLQSFVEATHGYIKAFPKEARMEVLGRTGAALETTRMQYIGEMSALSHSIFQINAGPLQWLNNPTEFLRVTGFNFVETMNRAAGANMGKAYAESLIAKKIKVELGEITNQKTIDDLYRQMDELGLSTRDKYHGVEPINYQNSVDRAGLIFSDEINFSNKTQNLPLAWQSPFAKMLLQFKTFQYHWGRFIKENLLPKKGQGLKGYMGNLNALIAFVAGPGALMGMMADETRRFVMADDRDFTMTERWLRGIGAIGGLGLWSTAIESFYSDPTRPYELIAGPTISSVVNSIGGIGDVISGRDTFGEQTRDFVEDVLPVSKAVTRRVLD